MGLLDILFGSEKKSAQTPSRTVSQEMVSYSGDLMEIRSSGFFGQFKKSKSGEWIIGWGDTDEKQHRSGDRESGNGRYVLYNTVKNKIAVHGKLERPNYGHVANNGYFSIEDWHFGSDLCGTFYIFSPTGTELIKKRMNANIFNSDISDGGSFAICQTANNPKNEDGDLLVAFDIEKRTELFSVHPTTGWADSYEFIEDVTQFVQVFDEIGKFCYDAQGNFIDTAKYDSARLKCNRFDVVLMAAEEILKVQKVDHRMAQSALAAASRARSLGADNDQSWKALALKIQGLSHELLGNNMKALWAFDKALKINSKIGVKHKADALRKKLKSDRS